MGSSEKEYPGAVQEGMGRRPVSRKGSLTSQYTLMRSPPDCRPPFPLFHF
jgi:hypothetical protein